MIYTAFAFEEVFFKSDIFKNIHFSDSLFQRFSEVFDISQNDGFHCFQHLCFYDKYRLSTNGYFQNINKYDKITSPEKSEKEMAKMTKINIKDPSK